MIFLDSSDPNIIHLVILKLYIILATFKVKQCSFHKEFHEKLISYVYVICQYGYYYILFVQWSKNIMNWKYSEWSYDQWGKVSKTFPYKQFLYPTYKITKG